MGALRLRCSCCCCCRSRSRCCVCFSAFKRSLLCLTPVFRLLIRSWAGVSGFLGLMGFIVTISCSLIVYLPAQYRQRLMFSQYLLSTIRSRINTCMNKYKNKRDDALTADWLRDNGVRQASFASTNVKLLQAQQQAHVLLTQHRNLLNEQQRQVLSRFQRQMDNTRTRKQLKPTAAHPVFNINSRVNRQLFRQHRHIEQSIT